MTRPVTFLDRDGTTIEERGYLADPDGVRLVDGAALSIRRLKDAGMAVVMLTNQSGVARGYFGLAEVEEIHHRVRELLAAEGAQLEDLLLPTPSGGSSVFVWRRVSLSKAIHRDGPGSGLRPQARSKTGIRSG
jgi:hypothetical protein